MTRVEQDPKTDKNQFLIIDPQYFTSEFQPALYDLFVQGGEKGVPGEDAQKLYYIPTLGLSRRKQMFTQDLRHLREILRTHYGHEVKDTTPPTRRLAGQYAHYLLRRIQT